MNPDVSTLQTFFSFSFYREFFFNTEPDARGSWVVQNDNLEQRKGQRVDYMVLCKVHQLLKEKILIEG